MIRKADRDDLDFIYDLYMHPEVNPFLLYEPMEKDPFIPIFKDLVSKEVKYVFMDDDRPVGMFKLVPQTHRTSHIAYLGGIAIDPRQAGRGLGDKMISEIIDLAKDRGFLRVELSVATINQRAIRLYEKNGFVKEGVLRHYTWLKKENRFLDEVMMAWLLP